MTETKKSADEIRTGLAHCIGSQDLFAHWTKRLNYTEGVQYLAESAGACWLIDVVASYQHYASVRRCGDFQLWELRLTPGRKNMAVVTCRADTNARPVVTQRIPYTDFPLPEGIKLYVRDGVLMLPSEN
jgi:hypothetical protein